MFVFATLLLDTDPDPYTEQMNLLGIIQSGTSWNNLACTLPASISRGVMFKRFSSFRAHLWSTLNMYTDGAFHTPCSFFSVFIVQAGHEEMSGENPALFTHHEWKRANLKKYDF